MKARESSSLVEVDLSFLHAGFFACLFVVVLIFLVALLRLMVDGG